MLDRSIRIVFQLDVPHARRLAPPGSWHAAPESFAAGEVLDELHFLPHCFLSFLDFTTFTQHTVVFIHIKPFPSFLLRSACHIHSLHSLHSLQLVTRPSIIRTIHISSSVRVPKALLLDDFIFPYYSSRMSTHRRPLIHVCMFFPFLAVARSTWLRADN